MRNGYKPTLEILQILFQTTAMKQPLPESITPSFWFSSAYKSFTSHQRIKCEIIALCPPPKVHTFFIKKNCCWKKMAPTDLLDTGLSQAFILSQPQYLGSTIEWSAVRDSVQVYPWCLFMAKSQAAKALPPLIREQALSFCRRLVDTGVYFFPTPVPPEFLPTEPLRSPCPRSELSKVWHEGRSWPAACSC